MNRGAPASRLHNYQHSSQRIGGAAPEWVCIFPYPAYVGEVDGRRTEWVTDDISQQSCVDYFLLRGNDLVIDYEHQSDHETEAPAAGRIVELRAAGAKGLLARVEWTDKARQQLEKGEYFYDSPSFFWSQKDHRIYGLRHLALTNNPASWNRPYITDHSTEDFFGIGRTSQVARAGALQLICATAKSNTERRKSMPLKSIIEAFREALARTPAVTGKELRADVGRILDAIPDTGDALAAEGAAEATQTLAQLVAEPGEESVASQSRQLTPIALALGIESADPRELALAVMSLKRATVPVERVRELESQLAAATKRSGEEKMTLEIARQRSAGKQITPAYETELLRVARTDYDLALSSLSGLQLTSIDLATQADAPAAANVVELETARQRKATRLAELPATASPALKSSTSAHEDTLAIARERSVTYSEANRLRLDAVKTAQAA